MSFKVEPLANASIGVQVTELDLDNDISAEDQQALFDLWIEHGVIVFKGMGFTSEQHLRLSDVFGENKEHAVAQLNQDNENPEFMVLDNRNFEKMGQYYREESPDELFTGYIPWHSDQIFIPASNHGALLRMIEIAEIDGRTAWIDTIAAYDALSDEMKERIANIELEYELCQDHVKARYGRDESIHPAGDEDAAGAGFDEMRPVAHPAVVKHPISGKKILNVSPLHLNRVVGMDDAESDNLLKELVAHVTSQKFSYVHDWQAGDLVLWDNWRTLHKALGYPVGVRRLAVRTSMHRPGNVGRYL